MCLRHEKYQSTRKPSNGCLSCWQMWCEQNPDGEISACQLGRIFGEVEIWIKVFQTRISCLERRGNVAAQLADAALRLT